MVYLYAGLGMAMLGAIVAMIEMAAGINRQQIFNTPPSDTYFESGVQSIDQQALLLIATPRPQGLAPSPQDPIGFAGAGAALCAEINQILKNNANLYPGLAAYNFSASTSILPKLSQGCDGSQGLHRLSIAPVENGTYRYSVYSCVLAKQSLCNYESSSGV